MAGSGEEVDEELLVDGHELGDEGLEVEDLLAPDHQPRLVERRPVHHLRLGWVS